MIFPAPLTIETARAEGVANNKPAVAAVTTVTDDFIDLPDDAPTAPPPENDWPAPRPLKTTPAVLDLARAIPPGLEIFRRFCEAVAEALQVPRDAVPPLALGIVSGCIGRTVETQVTPGWTETASAWFCVLMEAGTNKSTLVSILGRPLTDWQRDEAEQLRATLASYAERRRCVEAELNAARANYVKTKPGTPNRDEAQARVSDLADELDRLPALVAPCLTVSDFTPESLRDTLRANGEKCLWISAEVDHAALLGSRYAKNGASNFDLLLRAHCGDAAPASRVGRDVSLERPALSLCLCVQPAALGEVLRDPYARDKGLLPRLLLVTPTSTLGTRKLNPPPVPECLLEWWRVTLRDLLDLPWPGRVVKSATGPIRYEKGPRLLHLDREAKAVFDVFRAPLEPRLGDGGDLHTLAAFVGKLPGACVRIATSFAMLQDPAAQRVSAEDMRAAVAWADYLLAHYAAALGEAAQSPETKLARRILAAIKRRNLHEFSARDAMREVDGNGGVTSEDVTAALAVLVDCNWIRPAEVAARKPGTVGRTPSLRYAANPAVFE
jgi:replicative DNA helicase